MKEIAPETAIGTVSLTISDLERSLRFYRDIFGFDLLERQNGEAVLGVDSRPLLALTERHGARKVRGTTGLYHFAILLPNRRALALALRHLAESQVHVQGFSDHLVSEAIYLDDPDGNGIEIYRDRPRSEWVYRNGQLQISTEPLDIEGLFGELQGSTERWSGMPAGTTIGHIHLHVADLDQTERFYRDVLRFQLIARYGRAASFFGAGGYHHHIGTNTWAGTGAPPPPADAVGLRWFTLQHPSAQALSETVSRLQEAGIQTEEHADGIFLRDPAQNGILLTHQ